ncbi:MAG: TRAFs-binding domain-containing protein [Planctomycetota bacterium]
MSEMQSEQPASQPSSFSELLDAFHEARVIGDFEEACRHIGLLRARNPSDPYLVQQHALVTYKGKSPNLLEALQEALKILSEKLDPHESNDPETLGLWGAIHKRLWEETDDRKHLDEAEWAYERGFYLRRDYYNGINFAFLLDVRAKLQQDPDEATADRIIAKRVRRRVLKYVDDAITALPKDRNGKQNPEEVYWLNATRAEALMGLGDDVEFDRIKKSLFDSAPEAWMVESTENQLDSLRKLL